MYNHVVSSFCDMLSMITKKTILLFARRSKQSKGDAPSRYFIDDTHYLISSSLTFAENDTRYLAISQYQEALSLLSLEAQTEM